MAAIIQQLPALLGVLIGVLASFGTTTTMERLRWKHNRSNRLAESRVEAYAEFAHALKIYANLSRRLAANRGFLEGPIPIDQSEGLGLLAEAERDRGAKWERVLLLGDARTIEAGRDWIVECWRIEWFARGLLTDRDDWHETQLAARRARERFYSAIRQDLGISGDPSEMDSHPRFPVMTTVLKEAEIPTETDLPRS